MYKSLIGGRTTIIHIPSDKSRKIPSTIEEFWPLIRILNFWGMRIDCKNIRIRSVLIFFLSIISSLHYIWVVFYISSQHTSVALVLDNGMYALSAVVTCFSICHLHYNRHRIVHILETLPCLTETKTKYVILRMIGTIFFSITFFTISFFSQLMVNPELFVNLLSFGTIPVSIPRIYNICILVSHQVMRILLVKIPEGMLYVLYTSLCSKLKKEFRSYKQWLKSQSTCERPYNTKWQELIHLYKKLCQSTKAVDDVYSPLVMWWFLSFVSLIIFNIYDMTFKRHWTLNLPSLLFLTFYCGTFLDMTLNASLIIQEAEEIASIFSQMLLENKYRLGNEIVILYLKIIHEKPYLTGWKAFIISRSIILTVGSMILTYLVVVYQVK